MSIPAQFLPIGLLLSLLVSCGSTSTTQNSTPTPQATWTPSAQQQAQLAQFQQELSRNTALGNPKAGFKAQALSCPTQVAAPYDASTLSQGLYWYAPSDSSNPGGNTCRARTDGSAIAGYYDPSKPVLVFVHGWQSSSVSNNLVAGTTSTGRYNFWFPEGNINVADAWLKAGWNVAMYQWTQLADDQGDFFMPFNAQAKIWTANYTADNWGTPQVIGMRYMTPQGYSTQNMPTVSASELFYNAYKSALSQYKGPEIVRVVGHSLGAQMALAMANLAYSDPNLPPRERPARIGLLDPYWSPNLPVPGHNYAYLAPDANPAARSARIARQLIGQGVVID